MPEPIRTCLACGARAPKAELLRLVLRDGAVTRDERQRLSGRGAYVHTTEFESLKPRRVQRALRATGEK
ncbi:MAG TPA: YlxR family protein [Chloroflexota bacterium]|nr:YlxR family protein [Chloroflexota bacterium]